MKDMLPSPFEDLQSTKILPPCEGVTISWSSSISLKAAGSCLNIGTNNCITRSVYDWMQLRWIIHEKDDEDKLKTVKLLIYDNHSAYHVVETQNPSPEPSNVQIRHIKRNWMLWAVGGHHTTVGSENVAYRWMFRDNAELPIFVINAFVKSSVVWGSNRVREIIGLLEAWTEHMVSEENRNRTGPEPQVRFSGSKFEPRFWTELRHR